MIICKLCNQKFRVISSSHLKVKHNVSFKKYKSRFPSVTTCFPVIACTLPKTDYRYQKWLRSLRKRPPVWSKGKTKENDYRVRKISETFKKRKIDNFAKWRLKMIKLGKMRSNYPPFEKSKELAFIIGLVLGDGNITKFPRSECLTIREPTQNQIGNCVRPRIYQKFISKRLGIPSGDKRKCAIEIPKWVWSKKEYLVRIAINPFAYIYL